MGVIKMTKHLKKNLETLERDKITKDFNIPSKLKIELLQMKIRLSEIKGTTGMLPPKFWENYRK